MHIIINFYICTMHIDIIEVLFIHQMMHYWIVLKNNIKIYIKIYNKTAPTYSSVAAYIRSVLVSVCSTFQQ